MAKQYLDLSLAVWGKKYIDTMHDLALPSFLSPGNLPACANDMPVRINIFTRPQDRAFVLDHPIVQQAGKIGQFRVFSVLDDSAIESSQRYRFLRSAHRLCIAASLADRAIVVIPGPDTVLSDGSLRFALNKIMAGKDAVVCAGPRASLEDAQVELAKFRNPATGILNLAPKDLVSFAVRFPHDISKILYWDSPVSSLYPESVYWRVGDDSFICRSFDYTPLMTNLKHTSQDVLRCMGTIDGAMLVDAGFGPENIFISTESNDLCLIELSSRNHDVMGSRPAKRRSKTWAVMKWTPGKTTEKTRNQFRDHVLFYRGNRPADFKAASREMKTALSGIFVWLRVLDMVQPLRAKLRSWRDQGRLSLRGATS